MPAETRHLRPKNGAPHMAVQVPPVGRSMLEKADIDPVDAADFNVGAFNGAFYIVPKSDVSVLKDSTIAVDSHPLGCFKVPPGAALGLAQAIISQCSMVPGEKPTDPPRVDLVKVRQLLGHLFPDVLGPATSPAAESAPAEAQEAAPVEAPSETTPIEAPGAEATPDPIAATELQGS